MTRPPTIQMDYAFGKVSEEEDVVPILVAVHAQSLYGMAAQVRGKGRQESRNNQLLTKFAQDCGLFGKLRVRSDSEPAIVQWLRIGLTSELQPNKQLLPKAVVLCAALSVLLRQLVASFVHSFQ